MINSFVAFDVETPNLNNDSICSIGITTIDNGIITGSVNYLVNPECCFSKKNIQIHGITADDVIESSTFPDVWDKIKNLFYGRIVAAHNANSDLSVLKKTLLHYGIVEKNIKYLDTLSLAKSAYPQLVNFGLDTVCEYLSIQLNHHNSESDSLACATILCKLLDSGFPIEGYVNKYDLSKIDTKSRKSDGSKKNSKTSLSLNELKTILDEISKDGIIDDDEMSVLSTWINTHRELSGNYPYDKIYNSICDICADGVVTSQELQDLLCLLNKLLDPVNSNACIYSSFEICGKAICLTGAFIHGSKEKIISVLQDKGAIIQSSVNSKTDIVLVGGYGSDAWIAGNYGTKIKKALELKDKGSDIAIIKEADFFNGQNNLLEEKAQNSNDQPYIDESNTLLDNDENKYYIECIEKALDKIILDSDYRKLITVLNRKGYIAIKAKNSIAARIVILKSSMRIEVNEKYSTLFKGANIKFNTKNEVQIAVNSIEEIVSYAEQLGIISMETLDIFGGESFGCCSRYVECSDAKQCIHPDKLYSRSCSYRKNLESGKIFYGKNKNV